MSDDVTVDSEPESLLKDIVTAAELHHEYFPELVQFVPGMVSEGFGIIAGPPKLGKSWWVLNLALGVAAGGRVLGKIPVAQRPVLLLALEDSQRRLQDRIRTVYGDGIPPHRLHILTEVGPRLLIPTITEWLIHHTDGLVILDTLGRARPQRQRGDDPYLADYQAGVALKQVVDAFPGSALLGVHHTRKAASADFVDDLSGTLGLAGSADYILVLRRPRNSGDATLQVTGRDAPEGEYALQVTGGHWTICGDDLPTAARALETRKAEGNLGERSLDVLTIVNTRTENGELTTALDIATKIGIDANTAGVYLRRLVDTGRIKKHSRGAYTGVVLVRSV